MPNVMATLSNIGGALCSTPQSLADAHYQRACSNAAKMRKLLKLLGCPKLLNLSKPLVGRSLPYYGDMCGRYCCLTSFFQLSIHALVAKIQSGKVVRWYPDGDFCVIFASCISSEPRAAHLRPAFEICTKATPCVEVW